MIDVEQVQEAAKGSPRAGKIRDDGMVFRMHEWDQVEAVFGRGIGQAVGSEAVVDGFGGAVGRALAEARTGIAGQKRIQ